MALFFAMLVACAIGQYFLSARSDGGKALVGYAIGVGAFLVLLRARKPRGADVPGFRADSGAIVRAPGTQELSRSVGTFRWSSRIFFAYLRDARKTMFTARKIVGLLAAVLLIYALAQVQRGGNGIATLATWASGLIALLAAAVPWESVRLPPARAIRAWVLSVDGLVVLSALLVGAALRLIDLQHFPSGIHGDETGFGLVAVNILKGRALDPFGPGFLDGPAVFAYMEAPFIALFGPTITGVRFLGALCGATLLPVLYLLVRRMFNARTAILALLLVIGNAALVHFSRQALNLVEVLLLQCVAFLAVWEGKRSGHAFWWLLAGISAVLPIYFQFGALLFPATAALFLGYLLVARHMDWHRWLKAAAFMALGGIVSGTPMYLEVRSSPSVQSHVGARLIFDNWDRVTAAQHTTSVPGVLLGQIRTNLLGFFSYGDASGFYSFAHAPLIVPLLGPIVALGLLLMVLRWRDPRYVMLGMWFWPVVIISGGLSIDPPQAHRLLPAVIPALFGAALVLEWLMDFGPRLAGPHLGPPILVGLGLVPLLAGFSDEMNYFGPVAASMPFEDSTTQGEFVAALGPSYRVLGLGSPQIYVDHSTTAFLAPDVKTENLNSPATDLPWPAPADHDLAFLVYAWMGGYIPMIQSAYPGATVQPIMGHKGQLFGAILVPRAEIARWQGLTAHYGNTSRLESDAGVLGSSGIPGLVAAEWTGSVFVDKNAEYNIQCAGEPCIISIDGMKVDPPDFIQLANGWHTIDLTDQLPDGQAHMSLTWHARDGQPSVIPTDHLDARTLGGNLRGQVTPVAAPPFNRVDRALGFRDAWGSIGAGKPADVSWNGTLNVPTTGMFTMAMASDSDAHLAIDEQQLLTTPGGNVNANVSLTAGPHPIQVSYHSVRSPGLLELMWTVPGGQPSIIPPEAFS